MKKAAFALGLVLEATFVAGAFALDYFSRARLGMSRWLVYHNQKWLEILPVHELKIACLAVLAALFVLSLTLLARRSKRRVSECVSVVVSGAFLFVFAWFIITQSADTVRAYYLIALCLFFAALLQSVQSLVMVRLGLNAGRRELRVD